ncbi:TM2 domain-containing protein [Hymenobacter sp. BT175]|uniref:TM2 domain-containing protein n=1 Tax=Hymenobacter translucens TaxID=2886507 RepID=UPI001D0ED966|nr:TM2 domain-containing protein [Hymenobacter translucens]MCC2546884.1 TM2 domain-containing protein [Hymenobacter translucens]
MTKIYTYCLLTLLSVASLSSCSRSNYAFQPGTSPYHASQAVTAAAPTAEATASVEAGVPVAVEAVPGQVAAKALATMAARDKAAKPRQSEKVAKRKQERKVLIQHSKLLVQETGQLLKAKELAGDSAPAGKSQLTALLLSIFLGPLGVGRFYLGYTGRGLLYLGLALGGFAIFLLYVTLQAASFAAAAGGADTVGAGLGILGALLLLGIFVPYFTAWVLSIIDSIRIYQGKLLPKNGDYAQKLGGSKAAEAGDATGK